MRSRFSIEDLIKIAPPPVCPVEAGSAGQWDEVERSLGTALPSDYKIIINTYGSGEFNNLFTVFNPFSSEDMSLLWQAGVPDCFMEDEELGRVYSLGSHLEHYQLMRAEFSELGTSFSLFPKPGGLLPLGQDSNGGSAYWLMEGRPDVWPLIFLPHGFEPIERVPMTLLEFLVLWISGYLPESFDGAGKHFVNRTDPVFRFV